MKIGILTHPLHTNYGGLLQALALQESIEQKGHHVVIINREYPKTKQYGLIALKVAFRQFANDLVFNYKIKTFVRNNYKLSKKLLSSDKLSQYLDQTRFDAIIVGSDQVWRPKYSPDIFNYYLDVTEGLNMKRISYAASFGVDEWEYTDEETKRCSQLARQFDAISVREQSGVQLCKQYLGVDAQWVLDPTMLHDRCFYESLVKKYGDKPSDGDLFCYVLDKNNTKTSIINQIAEELHYKPFYCNVSNNKTINPSVTKWIRSFMDARMVLTDSFHGTVFSIIFNKPFWVIGNERRGLSRFESLLKLFGLEERLITDANNIDYIKPIEWSSVNNKLLELRRESLSFLFNSIE